MAYLSVSLGALVFLAAFKFLNVVPRVRQALTGLRGAQALLLSKSASDADKEAGARKAAGVMAQATVSILVRGGGALLAGAVVVGLISLSGLHSVSAAVEAASDWRFILGSTVALVAVAAVLK